MSSEPEESADQLDDHKVEIGAAKEGNTSAEKGNGQIEHAKPKRRRRGKKRKHKRDSAARCGNENHDEIHAESEHENHVNGESPPWDSTEDLSCDNNTFASIMIRPINVPKAPENSTQFIMDDHNECRLYMSFETPNPYLADPPNFGADNSVVTEPVGEDAAYRDIDYEYESPQDFDNSAYYDKEFEQSYKNNRFDELMRLSRTELIGAVQNLERRLKDLSDEIVKQNPSPILEKLQTDFLHLQERHSFLKDYNTKLTALVLQNETERSVNDLSLEDASSPAGHEESEFPDETEKDVPHKNIDLGSEPISVPRTEGEASDTDSESPGEMCHSSCESEDNNEGDGSEQAQQQMQSDCESENSAVNDSQCFEKSGVVKSEQLSDSEQVIAKQLSSNEDNCDEFFHEQKYHNEYSNEDVSCIPDSTVQNVYSDVTSIKSKNIDVYHIAKQTKCYPVSSHEEEMSPTETSVN